MNRTKIEWCDYTQNPVTGCWGPGGTVEKPNRCWYCYANRIIRRFAPLKDYGGDWRENDPNLFAPTFFPERLFQPSKIKKPSRIFVCSMGDLFGDWVPDNWIADIRTWTVNLAPWHTYIFLTKNPRRYAEFNPWPENCWLGATVTNQVDADERIPELFKAAAMVRFVSVEPMLGPTNLFRAFGTEGPRQTYIEQLYWLIIGAMTGPGSKAHQPKPEWVQSLIDQARAARVPCFIKGSLYKDFPIREWPK